MPLQKYDVPDPSGTSMVERYWSLIHVPIVDADGEVVLLVQRAENITEFMGQRGLSPAELERSEVWRRRALDVEADLYAGPGAGRSGSGRAAGEPSAQQLRRCHDAAGVGGLGGRGRRARSA